MSTETGTPVVAPATSAVTPAPAQKPNAIQLIEQELVNFSKQREAAAKNAEQAIANVHAVDGAIQGTQHLLAKLKAAAAIAEAEVKKLADEAAGEAANLAAEALGGVETAVTAVEGEVKKGIALVKTEAEKF